MRVGYISIYRGMLKQKEEGENRETEFLRNQKRLDLQLKSVTWLVVSSLILKGLKLTILNH